MYLLDANGGDGRRRLLRRQPGPNFDQFYQRLAAGTTGKTSAQQLSGQPVLEVFFSLSPSTIHA
jgi:hypothetical protein